MTLTNRLIIDNPCRSDDWVPGMRKEYESGEGELKEWSNLEGYNSAKTLGRRLAKLVREFIAYEKMNGAVPRDANVDKDLLSDENKLRALGVDVLETDDDDSGDDEQAWEATHKTELQIWRDEQARLHEKRKANVVDLIDAHRCR